MQKVAVYFINDNGEYYIENTVAFTGEQIPNSSYDHDIAVVSDESSEWRNYQKTKRELYNPTTKDGEVFVVIKTLENSSDNE